MNLELLSVSVVVVAERLNPALLHPGYLESWKVVGEDWELAAPPVSNALFSSVQYTNGITFNTQGNTFQISAEQTETNNLSDLRIDQYAVKYLKRLPDVNYMAVGINISGFVERTNPDKFLIDHFLKRGSSNAGSVKLNAVGLHFVYSVSKAKLTLVYDPGSINKVSEEKTRTGIIVNANYHTDSKEGTVKETEKIIYRLPERRAEFSKIVNIALKASS